MCSHHDNLDDGIEGLFGDLVYDPEKAARTAHLPAPSAAPMVFEEDCAKCRGRGRFIGYTGRDLGPCHKCKGVGKLTFKSSAEDRARKLAQGIKRKLDRIEEWYAAHPIEHAWLLKRAGSFDFARAMVDALTKYGSLTEGQLAAVRKCAANDAARAERFEAERLQRETTAKACDVSRIEAAFQVARDNKVRWPQLRLDTYKFKPAGPNTRNPGAVYVTDKDSDIYLGKIMAGKFVRSRDCTAQQEAAILTAASDPEQAAKAYGRRYGACSICGRELTVDESIDRAMGPVCASKYGWA